MFIIRQTYLHNLSTNKAGSALFNLCENANSTKNCYKPSAEVAVVTYNTTFQWLYFANRIITKVAWGKNENESRICSFADWGKKATLSTSSRSFSLQQSYIKLTFPHVRKYTFLELFSFSHRTSRTEGAR